MTDTEHADEKGMDAQRKLRSDIIQKLTEAGFLITEDAIVMILEHPEPLTLTKQILKDADINVVVIGAQHVPHASSTASTA
jgi:hypothetical protein